MKLCEGFTLVELTDDKIVQEKKKGNDTNFWKEYLY